MSLLLLSAAPLLGGQVVINEIMYHPSTEEVLEEYIELHNPTAAAVDLSGWRFADGVEFTFPASTSLPPGGYLVVAANLAVFQAKYPDVTNVVGDWIGQLSNSGETIELVNATGGVEDEVGYADAGDWGVRVRGPLDRGTRGWEWQAGHDGAGLSLELIQPNLANDNGQNWASSFVPEGTPGAVNSAAAANVAPLLYEVEHAPAVPRSTDAITIHARVVDELTNGFTVTLFYRVATSTTPPAFTSTPMFDDGAHNDGLAGDGVYGAVLSALANGTILEFYVRTSDGSASRTWPAPALDEFLTPVQAANAQLQVDNEVFAGGQPILRLIMTAAERQMLAEINQNSDAEMNTTLVSIDGADTKIRYGTGVRIRGAGSRGAAVKNHRVNIPSDRPWNGLTAINLNSLYIHAQTMGSVVAQKSGLPASNTRVIQVRFNGQNLASSGTPSRGNGSGFGSYVLVEPVNNEWAGNHFPTDPNGNVYRASSGPHTADLSYQGTNPSTYISRGYSKTSNSSENDWSDLIDLTFKLSSNTPDLSYAATVGERLNLREWMTYFAVFSLTESSETSLGTGEGDDYALYRGLVDTRFQLIGHDFDTIFNEGDSGANVNESIWVAADFVDQPAVGRFLQFPEFAPLYFEELWRLSTTVFAPAQINPLFDQLLGGFVPLTTINNMKSFNAQRVAAVQAQIPQVLTIKTVPSVSLISPTPGATYEEPATVPLQVIASDSVGVARVEYYANGAFVGQSTANPYSFTWAGVGPSNYTLHAVVSDGIGLRTTSAPVAITVTAVDSTTLISSNALWRYLDDGSNQGTAWRGAGFDDSAWAQGPAQLGYGDGDEATVVSFGPSSGNKYITTYFRKSFDVPDASAISALNLWLLRDDGAVVYLNGTEIFRTNLLGTTITNTTRASSSIDDLVDRATVSAALLVNGANVLAVEIHQQAPNSSDISFDFELKGALGGGSAPLVFTPAGAPITTTSNTVALGGQANAIHTRSVTINGQAAIWTPWRAVWQGEVALSPGVNRVLVQSFDGAGRELERAYMDVTRDTGATTALGGTLSGNTTLTLAGGPYLITSTLTVPSAVTLTIEPGATLYFATGASLNVAAGGRLLAEGTETQRIRFTRAAGAETWGRIDLLDAPAETRLSFVDIEYAGSSSGAVRARNSVLWMDNVTFLNTAVQYVNLDDSSFNIRRSTFPSTTGVEPIHGVNIPISGHGIIESNWFGTTTGLNDIIDFTGAQRPNAILQILNNTFTGASDDVLDLDGTDAFIEGNIFMHVHQETAGGDTASAVSGGADGGNTSRLTIVRNLFFDCDHASLVKEGNFYTFVNNTIVNCGVAAVNFNEPLRNLVPGAGALLDANIIWNTPLLFANFTNGSMAVTVDHSIIPTNFPGTGNLVLDPLLTSTDSNTITSANIRDAFVLRPGSPAIGTGANGTDMGALIPSGASIAGEPSSPTPATSATLTIGGPGVVSYQWRLDGGAWSTETLVTTPIVLTSLASGDHRVEVIGKNDAGVWQSTNDPAVSRTWTVNTSFVSIRLNEILARNQTALLHDGSYPDAVEIYNAGSVNQNLSGWGLSDRATNKFKFTFPNGTFLAPGEYLVVFADDATGTNAFHLGFALNQGGDALYLHNAGGALIDGVEFGTQLPDLSIGRAASGEWTLTQPTFGAMNVSQLLGDPRGLKINEWLADGGALHPDDFIEIYNPAASPVLLGGLFLSDEPLGWPQQHQVTPLTFMPARGFYVFLANGQSGAGEVNFTLSPDRGAIGIADARTNLIDCVFYGPQTTEISQGRQPDGGTVIASFTPPTPGAGNFVSVANCTVSTTSVTLMPTNKTWRYWQAGTDLGTSWRNSAFSDAGWPQGPALLARETSTPFPYPLSIGTPLALTPPGSNSQAITYYFRTHFTTAGSLSGFNVTATCFIDDGAVFYLNGTEVGRIRVTGSPVLFNTLAGNQGNEGVPETFTIPGSAFLVGDNVMAVEVHQNTTTSSDVVMGMALHATTSVTNCSALSVVLNEVMANNQSITNVGGTNIADWVELYNPSATNFNLAGLSLTDDVGNPRRWVFPSGVTLAPAAYLLVRFDGSAPASTNSTGPLNTGFGLGAGGDEVYLFDTPARNGALMDSVVFGIQPADFAIGRVPNGSGNFVLTTPSQGSANFAASLASSSALRINEWLANAGGNDDDFFELHNPSAQPVSLGGLYLTDDLLNPTKHRIANLSFISAGETGFVEFIADGNTARGADHVSFGLDGDGESIGLYATNGVTRIDSILFGAQENDVSEGRFPDSSTNIVRFPGTKSPGRSNLLPLSTVVIHEVLTHTDAPLEDAIELHNPTAQTIDLSGWYLTDSRIDPRRYRILDGTVLAPGGFVVLYEIQFNPNLDGRRPFFALNSEGDDLYLYTATTGGTLTGYRTGVSFGAAESGVSFGRHQTSVGFDFTALSQRTFGADVPASLAEFRAGLGLANAYPKVGPMVVSEIMYHPPDVMGTNDDSLNEFIELHNLTGDAQPLYDVSNPTNTWRLRDAADFDFPTNVTVAAGGFVLVVNFDPHTNTTQLADFRARYGVGLEVPIFGPYGGKLGNDNDNIELYKPDAPALTGEVPQILVDKVRYSDAAPWPTLADGNTNGVGYSLQRVFAANYGNDPVNWLAGVPTPGAASGSGAGDAPVIDSLTPSHGVLLGASDTFAVVVTPAGAWNYQWRFNGVALTGATNSTLSLVNIQTTNAGTYSVLVFGAAGAATRSLQLEVQVPASITQQPQNMAVPPGLTATFTVVAAGATPLSYQWLRDGIALDAPNSPSLSIPNAQTANEGGYSVIVTNLYGGATSVVAMLTINASPTILTQPVGTNVFVSETAVFRVEAGGAPPLRYQWRFNGNPIASATNATHTITNAQLFHGGGYTVLITNRFGAVLSTNVLLTVSTRPIVTVAASDAAASEPGANIGRFTLSRTGSRTLPLTVHFTVAGTATAGVDYTALVASPVTIAAGASSANVNVTPRNDASVEGAETVILNLVANAAYTVGGSNSATVTIADDDNILPTVTLTAPVEGALFGAPASVTLTAAVADVGGFVVRVEFYANGTNKVAEALAPPFTATWSNAPAGLATLTAVATDDFGTSATSAPVHITLNGRPVVTLTSPAHGNAFLAPANITLTAVASDPDGSVDSVEFYQGTTLLGTASGTNATLVWSNVPPGSYSLSARAIDNLGTISISAQANISVMTPSADFSDFFETRGLLTGFTNFVTVDNSAFTKEFGEPRHAARNGTRSAWLSWKAPVTGICTIDTEGSTFDTVLAVYTNNPPTLETVTNVVSLDYNDDAKSGVIWSRLAFRAVAGRSYQIAVDSYGAGFGGTIVLHQSMTNPFPYFVSHPQSQIAVQGSSATFTVQAAGPPPIFYQWRFNGTNLVGSTTPTLVRSNLTAAHEGIYTMVIRNNSGSVTSSPASLIVQVPPGLTAQPQPVIAEAGGSATFSVSVSGTAPLSYQWRFNGASIAGATGSSFSRDPVQYTNGGNYSVIIANAVGSTASQPAELIVRPRIVSVLLQTNGAFQLQYQGVPNKSYAVERTTGLTNWSAVGTNQSLTDQGQFIEPVASTNAAGFYRLRLAP